MQEPGIIIGERNFSELREFVYRHRGYYLREQEKSTLEDRMAARLKSLNFNDYFYYLDYLKKNASADAEIDRILKAVEQSENLFFRNFDQFNALQNVVLPEIIENKKLGGDNRIRILSVGCASGEDLFSTGMILYEHFPYMFNRFRFELVGTEIDEQSLGEAREGVFNLLSLENINNSFIKKYFHKAENGYQVIDKIRHLVDFKPLDLLDFFEMRGLGKFDIVLCSNVLSYLNRDLKSQAINTLHELLQPEGYLFVGPAEAILKDSPGFEMVFFLRAIGYKKLMNT
ncbi:MAG: protein-glutamate O-methyltransferase CheR [Calditrichia bacterium]